MAIAALTFELNSEFRTSSNASALDPRFAGTPVPAQAHKVHACTVVYSCAWPVQVCFCDLIVACIVAIWRACARVEWSGGTGSVTCAGRDHTE